MAYLVTLALLFFSVSAPATISFTVEDLRQWFIELGESPEQLPEDIARTAPLYSWVFVRGYLHELDEGYMRANQQALLDFGVPPSQIHFLSPPSSRSIEDNTWALEDPLREIQRLGPQPLVLVGHSKGAPEVVAFGLTHPQFVRDHVKAIISIQGVYAGTPVADALYLWRSKSRQPSPLKDLHPKAALFQALSLGIRPALTAGRWCRALDGLRSLTQPHNERFWQSLRGRCSEGLSVMRTKTLFIRTVSHPDQQTGFLQLTGWFLHRAHGLSDGLVPATAQFLDWLHAEEKCPLFLVDANHLALTHRRHTLIPKRFMAALVRGLAVP